MTEPDQQFEYKLLDELDAAIKGLLRIDQVRLGGRVCRIRERIMAQQPVDRMLERLDSDVRHAAKRSLVEAAASLKPVYPKELPISSHAAGIIEAMRQHQVVIVCGTTGSGKTTQLPKMMLELGMGRSGRIGCTQPRRLAATSMARRVADELRCKPGREVGWQVRFDDQTGDDTVIKFMTDGILLAETRHDRNLLQYDALIIDEAHERSLNIDFILGYLKNLLPKRPDLKIVISSATLDAENFSAFFDNAPVVEVEGRTYPVEDFFLPPYEDEDLSTQVRRGVEWISELDREGDVLVFLPGEREIREAADTLNGQRWRNTEILPLFGRLSMSEQQRVFKTGGRRRIVLATNVAETSITIPGIHYVIDSGLARVSRYNPRNQVQELKIEQISQASARQRRGRCGRIADGVCVYLYSRETLEQAAEFTDPEIKRTSLAGVILQMDVLGLPPIEEFPLLDPPQPSLIREGYKTLFNIGAIDRRRKLLEAGRQIATFPVDPHLAAMICRAEREKVLHEITVIVAYLSIQDPRERPAEKQDDADRAHRQWADGKSDFIGILNLWNFIQGEYASGASQSRIRRLCKQNFINYRRLREWINLQQDLVQTAKDLQWKIPDNVNPVFENFHYDHIHRSLLAGLPLDLGVKDEDDPNVYRGTGGRRFYIFPGSGLFQEKPEWLMAFNLVETTRVFARMAAEVKPEWLEDIAPHLCKPVYRDVRWNARNGFVYASESIICGGLTVVAGRRIHYGKVKPAEARKVFIREGMVPGNMTTRGGWLKLHLELRQRIEYLEQKIRRPGGLLDEEAIYRHFEEVIPDDVCSVKSLEQWMRKSRARIVMRLEDAMIPQLEPVIPDDYPDELEFYGHTFQLRYKFDPGAVDDGITLLCPAGQLNLLPDWGLDWLVPGWLAEKVRLLIRSLPKQLRIACNPAAQTAGEFAAAVKTGEVYLERPLVEALAEYLSGRTGEQIVVSDFSSDILPDSLVMKVGELDKKNHIRKITAGMPQVKGGSRVSRAVGGGEWAASGETDWPVEEPLPESIDLLQGERKGYPALVDEGETVGVQVFLDLREAAWSQGRALARLFRLHHRRQVEYLKKNLPVSGGVRLSMGIVDRENGWLDDFADAVVVAAMTDEGRIEIRDADTFQARLEAARAELFEYAAEKSRIFEAVIEEKDNCERMLEPLNGKVQYSANLIDIKQHLEFLFRTGFLRDDCVWSRYLRYMRALRLRMERLVNAPAKDLDKLSPVEPFQQRFDLSRETVADYERAFDLHEFALLLNEFRIAQFAPEVRPLEKVSVKRLEEAWEKLRL